MKNIAIMGSTGSIGTQCLDVIRKNNELRVVALSCGKNISLLEKQAKEFLPEIIVAEDKENAETLRTHLSNTKIKVLWGIEGLCTMAEMESSDIFVGAIVGMIGIKPTIHAIRAGKTIALANKETLVTAGSIITSLAREKNVRIIPVDSEHSAIFQCLQGVPKDSRGKYPIHKIHLTCSGGAFLSKTKKELENVSAADALKNPNWTMGAKVTVDSASLVNKGLEILEAGWLFDTPLSDISVVIQPTSIIHSMVEFNDGAILAQMGVPDMHLPIQYALNYPNRLQANVERLDLFKLGRIEFIKPDSDTFKGIDFALYAGERGGTMPTVFNAANEEAVDKFIRGEIRFLEIYDIIQESFIHHKNIKDPTLEDIFGAEEEARNYVRSRW